MKWLEYQKKLKVALDYIPMNSFLLVYASNNHKKKNKGKVLIWLRLILKIPDRIEISPK